ncbi:uncharacterized protein Pyn_17609 [Prunus yedoensis var. nudiflora]|uniref:CCHC-type domain-containing protein n=1 Tax=Prunus yedoensis var. nudiflora TaxID=2094558 RepID=A0A314YVX1_PRUYE|nr:uncharacterized protein Pyn_17609 [Prunus yedoensis var. nudiflora]
MEEVITSLEKALILTEDENDAIQVEQHDIDDVGERLKMSLVGKVFTTNGFNREAFKQTMLKIWNTAREVVVKDLGENLFLFIFATEGDRLKVLRSGPWNFDKALVLLEVPDGRVAPSKMHLKYADFWIQIHNVPLCCMTTNMGRQIGNSLGRCLDVLEGMDGGCLGRFLRIRVCLDVSKPLWRGKKLTLPSGNTEFVDFRYERLPEFCFCCGRVGHVFKECAFVDQAAKQACEKPYGIWLKATKDLNSTRANNSKRPSGGGMNRYDGDQGKDIRGSKEDGGSRVHGEWLADVATNLDPVDHVMNESGRPLQMPIMIGEGVAVIKEKIIRSNPTLNAAEAKAVMEDVNIKTVAAKFKAGLGDDGCASRHDNISGLGISRSTNNISGAQQHAGLGPDSRTIQRMVGGHGNVLQGQEVIQPRQLREIPMKLEFCLGKGDQWS